MLQIYILLLSLFYFFFLFPIFVRDTKKLSNFDHPTLN